MDRKLSIVSWAEEDRPREKLQLKGKAALSDAELIAILIGSGSQNLSAVGLSKQILSYVNNNLNSLAKLSIKDLTKFKGIGEAKAISVVSALELGRRRDNNLTESRPHIRTSSDVYKLMTSDLMDQPVEQFWIITLNRANRLISKHPISLGGVASTIVDLKVIFKLALEDLASNIILVHNHPSGNLKASDEDVKLTSRAKKAGKLLDLTVLDHVIFTDDGHFSFSDENLI